MHETRNMLEAMKPARQSAPCVSIYIGSTSGRLPEEVPSLVLARELAYARGLLENSFSRVKAAEYLKPLLKVAKDEMLNESSGSLGLFLSGDFAACVRIPRDVPTHTVVSDSFHLKPLARRAGSALSELSPELMEEATSRCREALAAGSAEVTLFGVAQALKAENVKRLWIAEDVKVWGLLNRDRGSVIVHPNQVDDHDDDILDDLMEWGLEQGIETLVLPRYQMPGQNPVIAEISPPSH